MTARSGNRLSRERADHAEADRSRVQGHLRVITRKLNATTELSSWASAWAWAKL